MTLGYPGTYVKAKAPMFVDGVSHDQLGTIVSGGVSLATALITLGTHHFRERAMRRRREREREASMQRIAFEQSQSALKQSQSAFASVRADVDRYRADVDRLSRIIDRQSDRLREVEAELAKERQARERAEARAEDLAQRLLEAKALLDKGRLG